MQHQRMDRLRPPKFNKPKVGENFNKPSPTYPEAKAPTNKSLKKQNLTCPSIFFFVKKLRRKNWTEFSVGHPVSRSNNFVFFP